MPLRFRDDENTSTLQSKIPFVSMAVLALFLIVGARLFYFQIAHGGKYASLATETFVREEEVVAWRGSLLDRNNKVIADTRPYFEIAVTPQYLERPDAVLATLAGLFPVTREEILAKLKKANADPRFLPVPVVEDIPYDWAVKLREKLLPSYDADHPEPLNGVSLRATPLRRYLYPELFSHALGYLREVNKEQLQALATTRPKMYSRGDLIGAAGLEKTYDHLLKGKDGQIGRVVDARGREVRHVSDVRVLQEGATIPETPGFHLRTTLDFDAQKAASSMFLDDKGAVKFKGAVVALDPQNGEVLALYSSPGFDGNRIMKKVDQKYWQKINLDEDKYLYNRAVQATYPQASTYKPMSVVAGILSGAIDPLTTKFSCGGGLRFGNRYFKCWNAGGHGTVDVIRAVGQSCDVFFYQVALKMGVDTLAKYGNLMGYGHPTGIDIPYEKSGLTPTSEWKKRVRGQEWIESETLSIGIGQGYNLATILQSAKLTAMIANGGYEITPHLAKDILNPDFSVNAIETKKLLFSKRATELVGSEAIKWAQKGMIEVVHGYGTATRLKASPYKIAGKTGTAQVIGHESKARRTRATVNHGLFIGYAPYDDPKIAVAVIVENGGSGSGAAAPVAMKVIDSYLGKIMPIAEKAGHGRRGRR